MRKTATKIFLAVLFMPCTVLLLYFSFRSVAVLEKGYSSSEMDWNADGTTSVFEFFQSSDVGKRTVMKKGRNCSVYFS